jgi:chemotaxis protein MotB
VKRRKGHGGQVSHERWLVSYADFITLLFAFFTTMYAISTVDARKLSAVVGSMQSAFARGDSIQQSNRLGAPPTPPVTPVMAAANVPSAVDVLKVRLDEALRMQVEQGIVDLTMDPRGLVVSIREAGSFPTGSADLSLVAERLLSDLATSLLDVSNLVRVEGHTDDVPIHTERFRSNWELSTARATAVVAFLVERGLAPARLSAAGYGEFHPRDANDSATGRARNRRVDIVVLNPTTTAREEPAPASPEGASDD